LAKLSHKTTDIEKLLGSKVKVTDRALSVGGERKKPEKFFFSFLFHKNFVADKTRNFFCLGVFA